LISFGLKSIASSASIRAPRSSPPPAAAGGAPGLPPPQKV